MRSRIFAVVALCAAGWLAAEPAVLAQQYPPRTPPGRSPRPTRPPRSPQPAECFTVRGEVGAEFVPAMVEFRGEIIVRGGEGCADPQGDVDIYAESERVFLGSLQAAEDGSFEARYTLPASIRPGPHEIIGDIEGRGEVRRPLEVLPIGGAGGATAPTDERGGVTLPRTGAGLLLLVLWALVLIGLGSLLVVSAWRWGRRFMPARALSSRRQGTLMLPPPEVPFVDTSRFTPYRSRVGRGVAPRQPLTEWDVASGSESRD